MPKMLAGTRSSGTISISRRMAAKSIVRADHVEDRCWASSVHSALRPTGDPAVPSAAVPALTESESPRASVGKSIESTAAARPLAARRSVGSYAATERAIPASRADQLAVSRSRSLSLQIRVHRSPHPHCVRTECFRLLEGHVAKYGRVGTIGAASRAHAASAGRVLCAGRFSSLASTARARLAARPQSESDARPDRLERLLQRIGTQHAPRHGSCDGGRDRSDRCVCPDCRLLRALRGRADGEAAIGGMLYHHGYKWHVLYKVRRRARGPADPQMRDAFEPGFDPVLMLASAARNDPTSSERSVVDDDHIRRESQDLIDAIVDGRQTGN